MREVAEELRQMLVGMDFEPADKLIPKDPRRATLRPEGCPYSIAENVAHALYWQSLWLAKIKGEEGKPQSKNDWPEVTASEWPSVRQQYLDGLNEAYAIASAEPFTHGLPSDERALKGLIKVACHGAYHLGQVALLKRITLAAARRPRGA